MKLYLAGNFVIMGDKEKEKALQKILGNKCCRLSSFFYKKEMDIVTELKGEENEKKNNQKKINKKNHTNSKRISTCTFSRTARIRKKKGI